MLVRMPSLTNYLPDLKHYLLNYPKASLPKAESFIYWQEAQFGLKPTIRINHLTIAEMPTHVAVGVRKRSRDIKPKASCQYANAWRDCWIQRRHYWSSHRSPLTRCMTTTLRRRGS